MQNGRCRELADHTILTPYRCRGAGMAGENAFLWKPDNFEQKFVAPHLFGMLCVENIAGHRKPIDMSDTSPPHEVKLEVFIRNSDPTK
jgi:hypothetical protein